MALDRTPYALWKLPFITTCLYFKSKENIYFLILSIFQLLTLGPLPPSWSPTGPFSTSIPLFICLSVEITQALAKWLHIWKLDHEENYRTYGSTQGLILRKDILPGHKIYLKKNDISPVDGYLLETGSKVNLSLLTGESVQKYVKVGGAIRCGSIIVSPEIKLEVTNCAQPEPMTISKKNSRIDQFYGSYMMRLSVPILVGLVLGVATLEIWNQPAPSLEIFLISCLRNWILFNSIIPFSAKILLTLGRWIEASKITSIIINDQSQLDDLSKINHIVCDKTGTITQNKLVLSHGMPAGSSSVIELGPDLAKWEDFCQCLGLVVQLVGADYSTPEDRAIADGLQRMGFSPNTTPTLVCDIDFTSERRMSSRIISLGPKHYIYTKGSPEAICQKLGVAHRMELESMVRAMGDCHPELRIMAVAWAEGSEERDLQFGGLIGIQDAVQPGVIETIQSLRSCGLKFSLCTGDRKSTAMAIAKEAGILQEQTLVLDGSSIKNVNWANISEDANFVAYNTDPKDKAILVSVVPNTMAIGDGFNDCAMFDKSTISVGIMGNTLVESRANFAIRTFSDLLDLFRLSSRAYALNANLANFTFYRCSLVTFSTAAFAMYFKTPLFDSFVAQAFNFAWPIAGLYWHLHSCSKPKPTCDKLNLTKAQNLSSSSYKRTTQSVVRGALDAIFLFTIYFIYQTDRLNFRYGLNLLIICLLNLRLLEMNKLSWASVLASAFGIILFEIYLGFCQSLMPVIASVHNLSIRFYLQVLALGIAL